jgi:drug/metabolite transporter (DMT)-like permease
MMPSKRGGLVASYAMLIAAAVLFGGLFSVNKWAAIGGVPALAYTFWQSLGAGALLLVIVTLAGDRVGVSRQHIVGYLVIGALVIGFPISLLTYIAPKLPASVMTLVLALSPPFTFAISVLVGIERFRVFGLLGLVAGFLGVLTLVAPGTTLGAPGNWKWFLLALTASVMFASSNVSAALLRPPAASSAAMSAGVLLGSSLVLLPIMLLAGQGWVPQRLDTGVIATLLATGINAAVLVLFFEVIRRAGPTFFAQFNYLAVPAGAAWGALIFHEHLSVYFFVAMLLMFIGMFLTEFGRGRT